MALEHLVQLERMYTRRFSHPLKHRFLGALLGRMYADVPGHLRPVEGALLLHWAARLPLRSVIVEIGTLYGKSTCYLAHGACRSQSTVYSVDPFDTEQEQQRYEGNNDSYLENKPPIFEVQERLEQRGLASSVQLICGFSTAVASHWTRPVDLLWIDGNHCQAAQDYFAWKPHLHRGSRVAFHDAIPRYYLNGTVAQDLRKIIAAEHIRELEQVKSIVTFILDA